LNPPWVREMGIGRAQTWNADTVHPKSELSIAQCGRTFLDWLACYYLLHKDIAYVVLSLLMCPRSLYQSYVSSRLFLSGDETPHLFVKLFFRRESYPSVASSKAIP